MLKIITAVFILLVIGVAPAMAAKPTPPPPSPGPTPPSPVGTAPTSAYDALLWNDGAQLIVGASNTDLSNRGHQVSVVGGPTTTPMPNGDPAYDFDGATQYVEVADADDLSITNTSVLTIEAWVRPDTLDMPHYEAEGYVHWLGKGEVNQHEYVCRFYNLTLGQDPTAPRPNRVSGYAFKLGGGQGAGSYFQDPTNTTDWVHIGVVVDNFHKDKQGYGTIRIYKNGVQRDQDSLGGSYHIVPGNGRAPLRIGTRDFASFYQGSIGKVAIYDYDASGHFAAHVAAMK
jgi:hypothetical protein